MKKIYPKNKELFKRLIPFAKGIINLFQDKGTAPVIHGSFAHFYYTKDKNMKVNDIDIMIKRRYFFKIIKLLEKEKIKFKHYPQWGIIVIKKGKLIVEIDMPGGYERLNEKNFLTSTKKIDFYEVKTRMITLKQLEEIYLVAYNRSKDDKAKILKKIKHLERFLGRKLR